MTVLDKLDQRNKVTSQDLSLMTEAVFSTFLMEKMTSEKGSIVKKEQSLLLLSETLTKLLTLNPNLPSNQRLKIIQLLDHFTIQQEYLAFKKGEISIADVKKTSKSMGKKFQSGFSK